MRIRYGLLALAVLTALPLVAQSNDVGVWYSTAKLGDTNGTDSRVVFDNAKGFGISYNHFWGASLSTEFTASQMKANGGIEVGGVRALNFDKTKIMPVTADVQWHFLRGTMFSPYVGAGLAYVKMDDITGSDLDVAGIGAVKVDSKVSWNAGAGLNIGIGRMFAVALDGKYIAYEPSASNVAGNAKLKLNPMQYSAGLKLRF